jgi:hypothetical protein
LKHVREQTLMSKAWTYRNAEKAWKGWRFARAGMKPWLLLAERPFLSLRGFAHGDGNGVRCSFRQEYDADFAAACLELKR